MFEQIFKAAWEISQREARQFSHSVEGQKPDRKLMLLCVTVAFCLSMIWYLGQAGFMLALVKQFFGPNASESIIHSANFEMLSLAWWVGIICLFYFLVPAAVIKILLGEKLSSYGLVGKGAFRDYPLYGILLGFMVPVIYFVSFSSAFQMKYPFYRLGPGEALWPNLWIWEAMYFFQFFALEFFFRGFMLHGLKHRFGFYSVFVMTIPYCMIHFGKPLPETMSAIAAGIILGALSLKSRSILLGVAIHYSVAILMDLFALWQKGML
jgi:uncharacterized protein